MINRTIRSALMGMAVSLLLVGGQASAASWRHKPAYSGPGHFLKHKPKAGGFTWTQPNRSGGTRFCSSRKIGDHWFRSC